MTLSPASGDGVKITWGSACEVIVWLVSIADSWPELGHLVQTLYSLYHVSSGRAITHGKAQHCLETQAPVSDNYCHKMIFLPQRWVSGHYDAWQSLCLRLSPSIVWPDSDLSTLKGAELSPLCVRLKTLIWLLTGMGIVMRQTDIKTSRGGSYVW